MGCHNRCDSPTTFTPCRSRQQDPTRPAHPPPHCRHNAAPPVKCRRRRDAAHRDRKKTVLLRRTVAGSGLSKVFATQFPLAAGRRPPNKKVCRLKKRSSRDTSNLRSSPECTPAAPRTPRSTLHLVKSVDKSISYKSPLPPPPRRRLARHPGAEVVEEIQTGSWLWGPDGVQLSGPTV